MNKILCPTDFSKTATNAVEYAALLAHHLQLPLTLLHVVHLPLIDTTDAALIASQALDDQKHHAQEKLENLCDHLAQKYGSASGKYNYLIKEALLSDAVKQLCRHENFDLVVIGTSGGGNTLEELLIGSNTQAVIESVKCPVLAVPTKAVVSVFKHMVYASDYQSEDADAIRYLQKLATRFNAEVEIVHVSNRENAGSQAKARSFQENLQANLPGFSLRFQEVIHPDEVEGLKGFLTTTHADCLVVLKKHKSFFSNLFNQSLSEQMTYQTKLPMLILHT